MADVVSGILGVMGLILAVILMLEAVAVRRLAMGAAFAENMQYVMAAVLCLATSVLVGWISRNMYPDELAWAVRLGADVLASASVAFLTLYFYRLRVALKRFLGEVEGESAIASAHVSDPQAADDAGRAAL